LGLPVLIYLGENLQMKGELNEETITAQEIAKALPIQGLGETWGEEIYFMTDIDIEFENPQEVVEEGDLAYWPTLKAFCIFYGPTPASKGNEIRAAGPVNVFGKIYGNLSELKKIKEPVKVRVERQ